LFILELMFSLHNLLLIKPSTEIHDETHPGPAKNDG
jgi:hypothetical protein